MTYLVIVVLALLLAAVVLVMFIALTVSIRRQDRRMSLSGPPRTSMDSTTRRLVGVHVRNHDDSVSGFRN
ncbi:hypothetical protein [Sphaerisporangium fuscum]|uniref:hypothetical protein n=1 Tax=Sphaerisporangium fuscum TaxID=2835868 RepID=UPI001BDC6B3B|nr:hypothetical protein [Sphaerisporangium fuscum]